VTDIEVSGGEVTRIRLRLELAPITESVTIHQEAPPADISRLADVDEFSARTLELLPLAADRFHEALPLLPSVLRGPDGRLNFNGARASQSALLVNGSNVTDPLTGDFAIELPLSAVETVRVTSLPYSAEFGRVTAAVAEVTTRPGGDTWDTELKNFFPKPRFRDGKLMGIGSATPHFRVSGPLSRGRVWFSQAFTYRFVRSRAEDLDGDDEEILRSFDTLTQLDFKLSDRHHLVATFSYFPVAVENLDIDTLHPAPASPDFRSWGWNVGIGQRLTLSAKTLVETSLALKTFDVAVRPKGDGEARLTVSGLEGNHFNELDRESQRIEVNVAVTRSWFGLGGRHLLKTGANLSHSDFTGNDRNRPVLVLGKDGEPHSRISFRGGASIGAANTELGGFVQDRWQLNDRLSLDLGVRYDYDRISRTHHPVPRVAFAWAPFADGRSVLRGGWGIFYDRIFVHAGSFERFPRRVETPLDALGNPSGPERVFDNRISPRGLKVPRGRTWNLEFARDLGGGWLARVNYSQRKGDRELVVDRVEASPGGPALVLSSRGSSRSRQFDVTLRKSLPGKRELLFSYVKSRAEGDLNSFEVLYGNRRDPLLLPSEYSLRPFDIPHRLLCWGTMTLPWGLEVAPGIELRSGFPYTVWDADYRVVGRRNEAGRFPLFLAADLRVMKEIRLWGDRRAKVGFQLFNLTGHFNPRDVQNNTASPAFRRFANSPDLSFGIRLQLGGGGP
jgi:hypothetical protein